MDSLGPFVDYLVEARDPIDGALAATFAFAPSPDLKRYLYRPTQDFCAHGGKRTRPALVLMGCEVVGGAPLDALQEAAAVEHFQSAALIHDDIADHSETRRGVRCLHLSEGVGPAINCGDFALVESFASVIEDEGLEPGVRLAVLKELSAMMERTVEGQALDLGWARDDRWDLTPDDYLTMATLKTAHYSAASPLAIGALVGGGDTAQVEALRSFGLDAGLAFQIQDDLLNLTGDDTGKDFRTDITEGKRTLMVVWTLAHVDEGTRLDLIDILREHREDRRSLERAVAIMEDAGALDHCAEVAEDLAQRALGFLRDVPLTEGPALEALLAMPSYFIQRTA